MIVRFISLLCLLSNICIAEDKWAQHLSKDIIEHYVTPDQFLDESASDWRGTMRSITLPLTKDAQTAQQAALRISRKLSKATGVHYSRKRSRACMNPMESLRDKKASCTGLSIFYAAALRSVGIPARIVGVLSWNHLRGNHTWTEVYLDNEWRMLEFNEKEFNTPWVMEAVGMLDSKQLYQRIMATSNRPPAAPSMYFCMPWDMSNNRIGAEDVSERYTKLARNWYEQSNIPADKQRLMIDLLPRSETVEQVELIDTAGNIIDRGMLPSPKDDMREMLRLMLPRTGASYQLRFPTGELINISSSEAAVQILRLRRTASQPSPIL